MKRIIIFLITSIVSVQCMEKPPTEASHLLRVSYTSLPSRTDTPPLDIELGQRPEFRKRRATLCTAISAKDIELTKSSFEKEFEWVNRLYLSQKYNNNQINQTAHEELQEKLRFTRQLFAEIDSAIAKEEARLELLRRLSVPGQFTNVCADNFSESNKCICIRSWPQWSNISLSVLAIALAVIYCKATYPSRLSTTDPCAILPAGQQAHQFQECEQSSLKNRIPCEIFDPHNVTQIKLMEDCCQNLINLLCLQEVDHYNDRVYPHQAWQSWRPTAIVVPSILAAQGAFQLAGYMYRRSKRKSEPIKQLFAQKTADLTQVEQDFNKLAIVDDRTFQEL